MARSAVHRRWSAADFERLVRPPLALGQYRLEENAFASWAYLAPEAVAGYLRRVRPLQPADWNAGRQLWFIDFLCFGNPLGFVRRLYTTLPEARLARWARSFGTGRVQKIGWMERLPC